jgi:hypothetical protein
MDFRPPITVDHQIAIMQALRRVLIILGSNTARVEIEALEKAVIDLAAAHIAKPFLDTIQDNRAGDH